MAWGSSAIFRPFVQHILANASAFDLAAIGGGDATVDTLKATLWNNSITPDNDVTAALSAYNAATSQWVNTANEVYQAGQWAQGGVNLTSPTVDASQADIVFFDAADTASGSAFTTPQAAHGVMVYDDTLTASGAQVADAGICYNYLGGANSVTAGTFTVVWHANGVFRFTL